MGHAIQRFCTVFLGITLGASSAVAQQQPFHDTRACDGEISSLSLGAIPQADAYAVDIFDPTETALRFRETFLSELNEANRETNEDGNLVFSFRSEFIFSGITSRAQVDPTYRGDQSSSRPSPRSDEDETRDLIRSDQRRRRSDTGSASQQVLVEAELRNKETQRVIWLATVRCRPLTGDRGLLMKFVSEKFIENLGMAVKQKTF